MDSRQVIIQSPCPKVEIWRLPKDGSAAVKKYSDENQVVVDVFNGKYGNGEARKKLIPEKTKYSYTEIQNLVNLYKTKENVPYTVAVEAEFKEGEYPHNLIAEFSPIQHNVLQSYNFTLSKGDVNGSFNLTFIPEEGKDLFNLIEILDVVKIYESEINSTKTAEYTSSYYNGSALETKKEKFMQSKEPVFTGIVKSKKYVSQMTDGGIVRRLQVSGIAATGLVSQFYVNLDTTAMAITKQVQATEWIRKSLSFELLKKPDDKLLVKTAIDTIWKKFLEISEQCGTPAIETLILFATGGDIFDVDDSEFEYPLASIFNGEQTQNFYSIIDGLIPEPVYEKYAYTDFSDKSKVKMKIKIRKVQFSPDEWSELPSTTLDARTIKAFDVSQSDNEVYTVFFSYLNGYPKDEAFLMRIAAMQDEQNKQENLVWDEKKYKKYGYRPLVARFLGYGLPNDTKPEDDTKTKDSLKATNENMQKWFGNLDQMLSGSFTLAMTYGSIGGDQIRIMPGEKVSFLDCEFYVEGISHSWNYGAGGEINISVSRGGKYNKSGIFSVPDITERQLLMRGAE